MARWTRTTCVVLAVGLTPSLLPFPVATSAGTCYSTCSAGWSRRWAWVLGAPVTLALRSVTTPQARHIAHLLRSRPLHLVANPLVALLLNVGGLVVLYATALYRLTTADPVAHQLVRVHFLAVGCLFAWVIAGPDPAPRRRRCRSAWSCSGCRRRPLDRRAAAVCGPAR